jgi:transposase InsO family protein
MARKVIAMETKLRAVFAAGWPVPVAPVCRQLGISRQTFYKYRERFEREGLGGLVERSRRPRRSPQRISDDLEDEIVRLRKSLPLENGAQTIAYHLARSGWRVPSVSTIHRVLVRRGMVVPQPQKRPRVVWQRFEWPAPNSCWQIDATTWALADDREVWIMDVLDDHSRVLVAARVCEEPTSTAAWEAFSYGAAEWGLPANLLSDNGSCFTGRFLSGAEIDFERAIRALGVHQIQARPGHPQTCGKLERSHRSTKLWLSQRRAARTTTELQTQLDAWRVHYNHHRPHSSLQGATPAERWHANPADIPHAAIHSPPQAALRAVRDRGTISWQTHEIGLGAEHAGHTVLVIAHDDQLSIHGHAGLIRQLTLDRTRRYQPSGLPVGRRTKHP